MLFNILSECDVKNGIVCTYKYSKLILKYAKLILSAISFVCVNSTN